jgi:hypothetical protein
LTLDFWFYGHPTSKLEELAKAYPEATEQERFRFLQLCENDLDLASKALQDYMEWRSLHNLDSIENQEARNRNDDKEDWVYASLEALAVSEVESHASSQKSPIQKKRKGSKGTQSAPASPPHQPSNVPKSLPQFARIYMDQDGNPLRSKDGKKIIHVLPAQMDKQHGSNKTYALALAFYLDRKLARSSLESGTILIDIRPRKDWPNQSALHLMRFVTEVAKILPKYFPGRMERCVVYTVPRLAFVVWKMAKPLLHENIAGNVRLIAGSNAMNAPPPRKKLLEYIDDEVIDQLEEFRSNF